MCERRVRRGDVALVSLAHGAHTSGIARGVLGEDLGRGIGRAVVGDDDLQAISRIVLPERAVERAREEPLVVVARDDRGDERQRDIELSLGDLPVVTCNIGELNQVFLNLVINSAQAISEQVDGTDRRGTITIATRVEGDDAVVEISDDGPGIPPELQDRIYEPFFTTKEIGQGSGQGLALARTTLEQHSGSIECTSAPGEGTTLTLRIPLTTPAAELPQAA
jgi:signal transduction histidine kinase